MLITNEIEPEIKETRANADYDKFIKGSLARQRIINGSEARKLRRSQMRKNLWRIIVLYKSPFKIIRVLRKIKKRQIELSGQGTISKLVQVNGKLYWRMNLPGWGSKHFPMFFQSEINRIEPHNYPTHRLSLAYLAITKKCPLRCEHCFEWDNLNQPEKITTVDIHTMIENLQSIGTTNIGFTGGEPMLRVRELAEAIEKHQENSAFWILTSGFNLTEENAQLLKKSGLTGVIVSIDDYREHEHDKFRGKVGSFEDAINAIQLSIKNDFVTVISTCITRENANSEYLKLFMEFAREMGIGFVQFLEPKPVGHYAMKDVILREEHLEVLEKTFLQYNNQAEYSQYPIIIYHGYYQRKMGCMSSGNRAVYVDTNGDFLSCPFCHNKSGSLLDSNFKEQIDAMNKTGCADYGSFE